MTNAEVAAISAELSAAEAARRLNDLQNVCTDPQDRAKQLEERAHILAREASARAQWKAMIAAVAHDPSKARDEQEST